MTVAVVGSLIYAIVTGLAYDVIKKALEDLKTFDVEEQPPPPREAAATAQGHAEGSAAADRRRRRWCEWNAPPPPIQTVTAPPSSASSAGASAPPPPPPPPPPHKIAVGASATGDFARSFSADDYPASAQAAGAEGTAQARSLSAPTGASLDATSFVRPATARSISATCNILRRRAKFTPARDSNGNPTGDTSRRRRSCGSSKADYDSVF